MAVLADMTSMDLTISAAAHSFMRRMLRMSDTLRGGVRLTVMPGGCSGLAAAFTIETAPHTGDTEISVEGLRVFLPPQSHQLLDGVTVDFADTPTQSGLILRTLKAAACDCPTSNAARSPALATVSVSSIKRL